MDGKSFKKLHFLLDSSISRLILVVLGSSILFASYFLISRIVIYNSDNASIVLEAQAMQHGNYLLRGWYVPTDNFLTIEIPLYALGLALGLSMTSLLHLMPALMYTLVVVSGGYLATNLLQGKQRSWLLLAFLALAAFPPLDMVQRMMIGPVHIGTVFLIFVCLIAYRHFLLAERGKKLSFAVLMLVLVLATVGDPFVLVLLVLPLLITEGSQAIVHKRFSWRENLLFLSVFAAVVCAFGIRGLLELAGLHNLVTAGFLLTSLPGMLSNFMYALAFLYLIFHATVFMEGSFSPAILLLFSNAVALTALLYAAVRWCLRFLLRAMTADIRVMAVMIWGALGLLAAFTLSTLGGGSGMRYLYPLLFFGGVLSFAIALPFIKRYALIAVTLLLFVTHATLFVVSLYQAPSAVPAEAQLVALLKEHHLTRGLGTYWVASMVTVQTEEQIVMRQVVVSDHQIHPYYFLADGKWFSASNLQSANFIVYKDQEDDPQACYTASVQVFGMPDRQYKVGLYTVLAWDSPLLTHIQPGYSF
ncbi:MAG TPA: hypothetical protein VFV38_49175 [Ktedonobacteraceae bacterium]|nr:hypothetical protein [Ktedonobacteraceae bacterium]